MKSGGKKLSKLTEVDIREIWQHEQYDFSNWLAKEQNIEYINEILGLTLTDIDKEAYVGAYRCDLVARDESSNTKVIIENQLESSNHDHLGKIITYASGLDANVVVWIVREAREEHISAIEWLNNNTNTDVNFFLIELHAYKIGDSDPAPKFEVIEKPNGFIKNLKGTGGDKEMTKTRQERLNFWMEFNELVKQKGKPFNTRKASIDNYYDVTIGKSGAHISISLSKIESKISVDLYISRDKSIFDNLYKNKDKIEDELGFKMDWNRMDDKLASRITYTINGLNFDNHSNYPELMNEIIEKVVIMKKVFPKYINRG